MTDVLKNRMDVAAEQGCKHLFGNLFLVPFDLIRVPDDEDSDDSDYVFKNPRLLTENGQNVLMDKDLSSELRDSIKSQSLLNPLICRWVEDEEGELTPQLVGGDRRFRAIDCLIKKKEMVCDARSCKVDKNGNYVYEMAPADEVYEFVICQVWNCNDDLEALALSWAENKGRVNLNDGHEIAVAMRLRNCGATDEKILEILQKDAKWLASTDRLIQELDDETLENLMEGRIDRASAKKLLEIEDPELRNQILEEANSASEQFAKRKKKRIEKKYESALDEQEIAEGDLAVAIHDEDEEAQEEAQDKIDEASKKAKRFKKEHEQIAPVTTAKQVKDAVRKVTGEDDEPIRCLSARKIREGLEYLIELVDNDGKCLKGSFEADPDQLELVIRILESNILGNDEDFENTIAGYYE